MDIDATKVVKVERLYKSYTDILGGVHTKTFIFVDGRTKVELHDCLEVTISDENKSDRAQEANISVLSIQRAQVGKPPFIDLSGNHQSNNESNYFGYNVLCTCDSTSAYINGMRFLHSDVNGISCASKCLPDTIRGFLIGNCHHVSISDTNYSIKNNQYQNFRGFCPEVMGGYLFDSGIFHLAEIY